MQTIPDEIVSQLSSHEKILWFGKPKQGIVFRKSDIFLIPFSIFWGGFMIFLETEVIMAVTKDASNVPLLLVLWVIPFVLIGLYITIGRFFFEAKQRASTLYVVTNERIMIRFGVFRYTIKSLNLRTFSDFSLSAGKNNEGTISFGGDVPFSSYFYNIFPGISLQKASKFELITNAQSVYTLIRDAQKVA